MIKCNKYTVFGAILSLSYVVAGIANAGQLTTFSLTRDCTTKKILELHFSGVTFDTDQLSLQKLTPIVTKKALVVLQTSDARLLLGQVQSTEPCDFYSHTKTSIVGIDSRTKVVFDASLTGTCGPGSLEGTHESLRNGTVSFSTDENREASRLNFSRTVAFHDSACKIPMF